VTPLAWLLGLILPACGSSGAQGIPIPPPLDLAHFERPATPNTALAAPENAAARPDIPTPVFPVSAPRLWAAVRNVAAGQPRTFPLAMDEADMAASWVARSAVWNFPDVIEARVAADGPGASTLALYSHSLYGRSDLGVNRRRLEVWLGAVNASLPSER
jgi:uncharacterized protein (DUF1499 family)